MLGNNSVSRKIKKKIVYPNILFGNRNQTPQLHHSLSDSKPQKEST